jgi:hypothetical protein
MPSTRPPPTRDLSPAGATTTRRTFVLVVLAGLVHVTGRACAVAQQRQSGTRGPKTPPDQRAAAVIKGNGGDGLPPAVADMRAAILAAVETGEIAEVKGPMDLNELRPEFGGPAGTDPIDFLKSQSRDGSGKDILELMGRLLEGAWAAIPGGRDPENNRIYVWPDFAEVPPSGLDDADFARLEALVGAAAAETIRTSGRWTGWRLSIGADGVWHMFSQVR